MRKYELFFHTPHNCSHMLALLKHLKNNNSLATNASGQTGNQGSMINKSNLIDRYLPHPPIGGPGL